jgi:hypothetical protein
MAALGGGTHGAESGPRRSGEYSHFVLRSRLANLKLLVTAFAAARSHRSSDPHCYIF